MRANFSRSYNKLLDAIELLKEVAEDFKIFNEDALKEVTSEQQDLLHIIENRTITDDNIKIKLVNHLETVRKSRRNIKKIMEMNDVINQPLLAFLESFQHSKNHLANMKNSFDSPIYRIRNQYIYDLYLSNNNDEKIILPNNENLVTFKKQLYESKQDNHHLITYVQNEEELLEKIQEKKNIRGYKIQKQLSLYIVKNKNQQKTSEDENFEQLLAKQNIIEATEKLAQEDKKLLAERIKKNMTNKSKKNKAKAMKKLKRLKNKENKQTVLDLFKELENNRYKEKES